MSTCNKINDETLTLLAFGADEAPAEAAAHLAGCKACRAQVDDLRATAAAVRLAPVEPPAALLRGLRLEAERVARKRRRFRLLAWRLFPATAVAALALLLVYRPAVPTAPAPVASTAPDQIVALAQPLNLSGLEADVNRGLDRIGMTDGSPAPVDPAGNGPAPDVAPTAAPTAPVSATSDPTKSLDQLEVSLAHLERDLGMEPAGPRPAKGE